MARRLGISETTGLVWCTWYALVNTYQTVAQRKDNGSISTRITSALGYPAWSDPTEELFVSYETS